MPYRTPVQTKSLVVDASVGGGKEKSYIDAKVKINDIVKAGAVQDAVSFLPGGIFGTVNVEVDLDWDIPGGRLDGFVDNQASVGEFNLKLTGKGSANNITWMGSGVTASGVTLTGSPQIITNLMDDDITLQIRGGTVSAVQTGRVGLHWARPVASVSGNVLTVAGDVSAGYTTARHVVFLGAAAGASELGAQHYAISAVSFSGGNTSITLSSAPPAAGTYSRIAVLLTDLFANVDGSPSKFLCLPRGRAVRVTYSAAPTIMAIPTKQ